MWGNGFFCRPPDSEAASYRANACIALDAFADDGFAGLRERGFGSAAHRGPLLAATGAVIGRLNGGRLPPAALWVTTTLFGLLMVGGAYRLSRVFLDPFGAGAVAALTACAPMVVATSRHFRPQIAAAAMTVWALDACLRSRRFSRYGTSFLAGGFVGLSALGKSIGPLYVVGGAVIVFAAGLRADPRRAIRGGALAVVGCLVACGWWVIPNFDAIVAYADRAAEPVSRWTGRPVPDLRSLERWTHYAVGFANRGYGVVPAVVMLALALIGIVNRRGRASAEAAALAASVLVAYVAITVGHLGDAKFTLTFVPSFALAAVCGWTSIANRGRRRVAAALLLCAGVTAFGMVMRPLGQDVVVGGHVGDLEVFGQMDEMTTAIAVEQHAIGSPSCEAWPLQEFARAMASDGEHLGRRARVLAAHPYLCIDNLRYSLRGSSMHIVPADWAAFLRHDFDTALRSADYLIVDSAEIDWGEVRPYLGQLGIRHRVLGAAAVTDRSTLRLVRLVHR